MKRRKFIWQLALFAISIAFAAAVVTTYSQSGSKNQGSSSKGSKYEIGITVEGKLQLRDGNSATGDAVNQFAFKVTKAVDENGREMTELRDQSLNLLDNSKSRDLIKKHRQDEKLTVKGGVYLQERVLVVKAFKKADSEGSSSKSQGSGGK